MTCVSRRSNRARIAARSSSGVLPDGLELARQAEAMRHAGGEDDRLPIRGDAAPVLYDVAHQLGLVEPLGEVAFYVIAQANAHALEVWHGRREVSNRDQEALLGQRLDGRPLHHRLERAPEAAAIRAYRGRRQAQDDRLGVASDDLLIGFSERPVRLVDENNVRVRHLHLGVLDAAHPQRLYARHLDQPGVVGVHAGHDDAVRHAEPLEFAGCLVDQLAAMHNKEDRAPLLMRPFRDLCRHDRLTGAGG